MVNKRMVRRLGAIAAMAGLAALIPLAGSPALAQAGGDGSRHGTALSPRLQELAGAGASVASSADAQNREVGLPVEGRVRSCAAPTAACS